MSKLIIFFFLFLAICAKAEDYVSLIKFISQSSNYSEKRVTTVGILGEDVVSKMGDGSLFLYIDRDSKENQIFRNAIMLSLSSDISKEFRKKIPEYYGRYVLVSGIAIDDYGIDRNLFSGWIYKIDRLELYSPSIPVNTEKKHQADNKNSK